MEIKSVEPEHGSLEYFERKVEALLDEAEAFGLASCVCFCHHDRLDRIADLVIRFRGNAYLVLGMSNFTYHRIKKLCLDEDADVV